MTHDASTMDSDMSPDNASSLVSIHASVMREHATDAWKLGEIERATTLFADARACFPNDAETFVLSGEFVAEQGNSSQAAQFFATALHLNPDHLRAQKGLLRLDTTSSTGRSTSGHQRRNWLRRR
jgi:cytochrome c-type biogenesis protein CcmH/NrfG